MIDQQQIRYLEKLARIELNEGQRALFREEIGRILEYMERLSQVDETESTGLQDPESFYLREDEERPSLQRDRLLAACPDATEAYITAPRTIQ